MSTYNEYMMLSWYPLEHVLYIYAPTKMEQGGRQDKSLFPLLQSILVCTCVLVQTSLL